MIEFTTPIHKTNILPLRWFANLCEKVANRHLNIYLHYSDHDNYGLACRYHAYVSNIFYKPYLKWGTTYEVDMDAWRKSVWGEGIDPDAIDKLRSDEVLGRLGSDYDENGIPYWEKWHTDGN